MNKQSLEFRNAMDTAFGKGLWKFDNFTDGTIHFTDLLHIPITLRVRVADRYPKLMSDDIIAYNNKPGLVTDKAKIYKPLTTDRMARIKEPIRMIAKM